MASQVLFYNGIIYNTAPNGENYQYMIVDESSGFVVKCGHETDVASSWQGTKHDLQGKYVLPGLHDSHIHTYLLGIIIVYMKLMHRIFYKSFKFIELQISFRSAIISQIIRRISSKSTRISVL